MTWLFPSVVATLAGAVVLALAYFYLYYRDRERCIAIWTLGWAIYALRFVFMLLILLFGERPILLIGNQLFSLVSGLLLLWGSYVWIERRIPGLWVWGSVACGVWIVLATLFRFSFWLLALPTFTAIGVLYILTGVLFIKEKRASGLGQTITAWTFILWGVHKIDYPFLRPVLWFAPWGYLLGAVFELVTALGMILIYFERARDTLQESEEQFRILFETANDAIFIMRGDAFVACNQAAVRMFRCEDKSDILGRTPWEFAPTRQSDGQDSQQKAMALVETALNGNAQHFEWKHVRKDGVPFDVEVSLNRLMLEGKSFLQAIVRDITERKRAEAQIQANLAEKETLLREIHHRVKNNLQVVSSLLDFQAQYTQDEGAIAVLHDSRQRVRAMALVHEQLYQPSDLSHIDMAAYVRTLAADLLAAYQNSHHPVQLQVDIQDIFFEVQTAIPCGLIINELVSNAFKHAFPTGADALPRPHQVRIAIDKRAENCYHLCISDNGVGLPPDFQFIPSDGIYHRGKAHREGSLGLFLVETFVRQLKGSIEWHGERGTRCEIVF